MILRFLLFFKAPDGGAWQARSSALVERKASFAERAISDSAIVVFIPGSYQLTDIYYLPGGITVNTTCGTPRLYGLGSNRWGKALRGIRVHLCSAGVKLIPVFETSGLRNTAAHHTMPLPSAVHATPPRPPAREGTPPAREAPRRRGGRSRASASRSARPGRPPWPRWPPICR